MTPVQRFGGYLVLRSLVLVAVLYALSGWQAQRLARAARWVDEADQVIARINFIERLLVDKETGLRGYLVTRAPVFLEPYLAAHPDEALVELAARVADDPPQVDRAEALRRDYLAWLAMAERAREDPIPESTLEAMLARKRLMDGMRARVKVMRVEEEHLRAQRGAALAWEVRATQATGWGALLVLGAFLVVLSRRERRRIAQAYDAALDRAVAGEATAAGTASREREGRLRSEEALRIKEEFLWTLSHELRTPLTAVVGWASILRRTRPTGEVLDRAAAAIERGARAEARIVDDLLDASRIATGKLSLTAELTSFDDAVTAAVELCRDASAAKGVKLVHLPAQGSAVVLGDAQRLQQVAWNLISNAVKFTPRGGRVEVGVERRGEDVVLQVRDEGEGMAPEFLPHVFERFRQAEAGMRRRHGGLGLGLAIAKHFVEAHGGTIDAESAGEGLGATFRVTLPAAGGAPRASLAPRAPAALQGVRVLVVEDDPDTLGLISEALRGRGADVCLSALGADALTILARTEVDVLVSDIGLPDMDGYDLLDRARATRGAVPALALTAYVGPEDIKRAHVAGFDRYLAKPFCPETLAITLAELVRPAAAS
jgi:signal transduction histidine kinase/CheY-like chemotaxis protein